MCLLIYLPPPYPSHLAGLLRIYYTHTIAEPSVLATSQSTGLTTAYMYMYNLFELIQLW